MHFLNRTCLIGQLEENPHIFLKGNNENLATFTLLTPIDGSQRLQKHHVLVEAPLLIECARSCLSAGNLVFVEGQLEQIAGDSETSQDTWIVVSKPFGLLHPVYSHVHASKPSAHNFSRSR